MFFSKISMPTIVVLQIYFYMPSITRVSIVLLLLLFFLKKRLFRKSFLLSLVTNATLSIATLGLQISALSSVSWFKPVIQYLELFLAYCNSWQRGLSNLSKVHWHKTVLPRNCKTWHGTLSKGQSARYVATCCWLPCSNCKLELCKCTL